MGQGSASSSPHTRPLCPAALHASPVTLLPLLPWRGPVSRKLGQLTSGCPWPSPGCVAGECARPGPQPSHFPSSTQKCHHFSHLQQGSPGPLLPSAAPLFPQMADSSPVSPGPHQGGGFHTPHQTQAALLKATTTSHPVASFQVSSHLVSRQLHAGHCHLKVISPGGFQGTRRPVSPTPG